MKSKGSAFILFGVIAILAAFGLLGYNFLKDKSAGVSAEKMMIEAYEVIEKMPAYTADQVEVSDPAEIRYPDYVLDPTRDMPTTKTSDGSSVVAVITFPKLGLTLPVINEWSYANLDKAPCRYSGTAYKGNLVIAGHNFTSHFGRLDNLAIGDEVILTDIDANEFHYAVKAFDVLAADETKEMKAGDCDLTLFTCTLSGTSRYTVRCDKIK